MDQHKVQDTKYSTRDKTLKAQVSAGSREKIWDMEALRNRLQVGIIMELPIVVFVGLIICIELLAAWSHLP